MGPIIFMFFVIISLLAFGSRQRNRSNKLKNQFRARLHSVGIHESGLPQVSEGKKIDVLLGNENLFIISGQQIFELSLHKVRGVHYPDQNSIMKFRSYLRISYDMNGRLRTIVLVFMKPAVAKAFLWEIERELFTRNSSNGVIRL